MGEEERKTKAERQNIVERSRRTATGAIGVNAPVCVVVEERKAKIIIIIIIKKASKK